MLKKLLVISTFFLLTVSSMFSIYSVLAADEIEIIGPKIRAGTGPRPRCENSITSCGDSGHCVDLTGMVYCVRGRVVVTKCLSNNIRNETLTTSCDGGSFRIRIRDTNGNDASANITMYEMDSSDIIGRSSINGEGSLNSLESSADMDFDFLNSEFNFLMKGVDFTDFRDETTDFVIDNVTAVISGATIFKTLYVELPENFTLSTVILKIKYSDISINESDITLYKCSDFDISGGTCDSDWEIIPIIRDSVNKIAIAEVDSFSAYALGDSGGDITTTTTTTLPPTTTTTTTIPPTTTTTSPPSSPSPPPSPPASHPCELNGICDPWETPELCPSDCPEDNATTTTTTIATTSTTLGTDTNPETTSGSNNQENIGVEQDGEKITGLFSMVSNYIPIVVTITGMAVALILTFSRKTDRGYPKIVYRKVRYRGKKTNKKRTKLVLNL